MLTNGRCGSSPAARLRSRERRGLAHLTTLCALTKGRFPPESAILGSATGQSCALVDLTSSDGVTAASRPSRPNWNGAVRPSLCANQSRSRRSACPVYYPHERDAAPSALLPKVAFNSGRNSCPDYFLIEPVTTLPWSVLFRSTSLPPNTITLKKWTVLWSESINSTVAVHSGSTW
jgi:hypothetical protein